MAHLIGLRRSQACVRAPVGAAIALSLLMVTAVEGSHEHTEDELPAVCAVCELGHQSAPTSAMGTTVIVEPGVVHAAALPGHRPVSGTVHLSAHRSRAPPPTISL